MSHTVMANLRANIMDFRGFDKNIILILMGGIPRPIGDFPGSLSQAILLGIMRVGRLGVKGWDGRVSCTQPHLYHRFNGEMLRNAYVCIEW